MIICAIFSVNMYIGNIFIILKQKGMNVSWHKFLNIIIKRDTIAILIDNYYYTMNILNLT